MSGPKNNLQDLLQKWPNNSSRFNAMQKSSTNSTKFKPFTGSSSNSITKCLPHHLLPHRIPVGNRILDLGNMCRCHRQIDVPDVAYVIQNSTGIEHTTITETNSLKQPGRIVEDNGEHVERSRSRIEHISPSLPPVAENHVDAPWLDLDLGEDFDPNSFSPVEKGLGPLLEPVKSKFLSSQSDLAQKSLPALVKILSYNKGMQERNVKAIHDYSRIHDESVDITTLEAIHELLSVRIGSIQKLIKTIETSVDGIGGISEVSSPISGNDDEIWAEFEDSFNYNDEDDTIIKDSN
ncbi:hypothetical protein EV421DRAFT_1914437 [Armillaria borealis]|uniref:Uncharacterized protein n=1 Tax=Armillaria borealis TaxID=47425 RepID=A0AA39IV70_9AGAR|nr:hypothetical protein EV421DRAFT_1914437 [Armillaria borealis]